jgi:alanine dehydrogenase
LSEIRFLSGPQIESVGLTAQDCVALIQRTLEQHSQGTLEMPPKSGVHPPKGRHVHAMSAFLPNPPALGLKWIADFPGNPSIGLPTLSAVIILNDPDTGVPLCIMDGGGITASRTAGMTAVSLLACARGDAETAAIVGTGVQAAAQARMLPIILPGLQKIFVAGSQPGKAARFCQDLGSSKLHPAATRKEAVERADIVVTVTNAVREPLLEAEWLRPGVTVSVLDNGGKEIRILPFVDRIFVDDRRPFASEEVQHRFPTGVPQLDAEIGEILSGRAVGRRNDRERILILNLGIGACDIAVAAEVYKRSVELGIGTKLSL